MLKCFYLISFLAIISLFSCKKEVKEPMSPKPSAALSIGDTSINDYKVATANYGGAYIIKATGQNAVYNQVEVIFLSGKPKQSYSATFSLTQSYPQVIITKSGVKYYSMQGTVHVVVVEPTLVLSFDKAVFENEAGAELTATGSLTTLD